MLELLRKIVQEVNTAKDLDSALNIIVKRVQRAMHTHVCSVYLLDEDNQRYVLRATEGLSKTSVGVSMGVAEGIVGKVGARAEPINVENAAAHPDYFYVPGTGEEDYHAFLGVPIIHKRRVLGVLVVQQKHRRRFDESEEAFLVTMSAQLAGVIAHAEVTGGVEVDAKSGKFRADAKFDGVSGAPGVAVGTAIVMAPPADLGAVPDQATDDIEAEIVKFKKALAQVRHDIKVVGRSLSQRLRAEEQALFDVYLRMLDDNALAGEVIAVIEQGQWAQGALRRVIHEHIKQFSLMDDPYLRERATDIKDLGRRVLAYLQESGSSTDLHFPDDTILVAEEITATMLGEVPIDKLIGLVSIMGSGNSHAAILARSMEIPTVMGVLDLPYTQMHERQLILDGYLGRVFVNPSEKLSLLYDEILKEERVLAKGLESLKDQPSVTLDGQHMPLWVNTGMITDVALSLQKGAEGVGLYRTEVPFMTKEFFPSETEQVACYRDHLEPFAPYPVTMRTLDIGGDKSLPYFPIHEENPFLGWRGIRVTLDHPEIFLVQVRAMLLASEGLDNLRIMLPMITNVREIDEGVALIERALEELNNDEGHAIVRPQIGIMVEVPAAVYQARAFSRRVDFISVGSNDLTQYLLAVDRNNPRVAGLYNAYHPAVLSALQHIVNEAHKEQIEVGICGEMAGDPGGALLLMGMGYDVLSMNSANLSRVKSAIRGVSTVQIRTFLDAVMALESPELILELICQTLKQVGLGHLTQPVTPE